MVVDYQNAKTHQKVGFQDQSDPSKSMFKTNAHIMNLRLENGWRSQKCKFWPKIRVPRPIWLLQTYWLKKTNSHIINFRLEI